MLQPPPRSSAAGASASVAIDIDGAKFDGETVTMNADGTRSRFSVARWPPYLYVHYRRFLQNDFAAEKNPTLVTFPLTGLDLAPYCLGGGGGDRSSSSSGSSSSSSSSSRNSSSSSSGSSSSSSKNGGGDGGKKAVPSREQLLRMSVGDLRQRLQRRRLPHQDCVEKQDLVARLHGALTAAAAGDSSSSSAMTSTRYNLLASACHQGKAADGVYLIHTLHAASATWYETQDLDVWTTDTMPQIVAQSESYMQVYECASAPAAVALARQQQQHVVIRLL